MDKYCIVSVTDYFKNNLKKNFFIHITNKKDLNLKKINTINPRIIFFPHWNWKIPEEIFNNYLCLGFHSSPLPYGRGGSPIQNMIVKGNKTTQVCAIKITAGLDEGPVYKRVKVSLTGTGNEIFDRIYRVIISMINKFLIKLPNPKKQVGKPVVFKRRKPEQSNIFNLDRISDIYNHIRMLDIENKNFPKAFIKTKNFIYIFSKPKFIKKNLVCQALIKKIN